MDLLKDVKIEILSRITPLQELDKCKTVCKEWNQLLQSSEFKSAHQKNTNTTYGFYIQRHVYPGIKQFMLLEQYHKESFRSDYSIIELKASSKQGILFCRLSGFGRLLYCVLKPSIRQYKLIPDPVSSSSAVKNALLVLHSYPLRYKIVRFLKHNNNTKNSYECEVFDSQTATWKIISTEIVLEKHEIFESISESVTASGIIYWLTSYLNVVAFNPADETRVMFLSPKSETRLGVMCSSLVEYEGKLGFTCSLAPKWEFAELWVLDDLKSHTWRLVIRVQNPHLNAPVIRGVYDRDVVLLRHSKENKIAFYNLRDFSIANVGTDPINDQIFPFRSDCHQSWS